MKILMLCDGMDCGGAETHLLTLSRELTKMGHGVTLASEGGRMVKRLEKEGVRHVTLPLASHDPLKMLYCREAIRRLIKKGNFSVVHSHSRLASTLAEGVAQRYGVCFVTTAHAKFPLSPLRKRLSKWGESTVAVSQDIKQYLIDSYGLCPENIAVIPNGIDSTEFRPDGERGREGFKIVFLSRLEEDCSLGAKLLISVAPRLFERFSDLEIVIGGGGGELAATKALADDVNRRAGKEIVKCVGNVENTAKFMEKACIFVGVSRAALEAAFCAVPVILCGNEGFFGALDLKNFETALATNFCGRGEKKADGESLFEAVCRMGENTDAAKAEAYSLRRELLWRCSSERMAEETEIFYQKSVEKKNSRNRGKRGTLLCGYYGFGNMGDDILLRASLERARKEYPNDAVCVLTRRGRADGKRFSARCVRRSSPFAVLYEIARCKRLIFGGGTLLQSDTSMRSLRYYSSLIRAAKFFGKECLLWGNGVGRARNAKAGRIICRSLSYCSYAGMRDLRSLLTAKRFNPNAALELDLAQATDCVYSESERADYLLYKAFGRADFPFVAAALKGGADAGEIFVTVKALLKEKSKGAGILFIPMCRREDEKICRDAAEALGGKVLTGLCFGDVAEIMKRSRGVFSMRLHGLVAAKRSGVDFFGVGKDEKIKSYCREQGGKYLKNVEP